MPIVTKALRYALHRFLLLAAFGIWCTAWVNGSEPPAKEEIVWRYQVWAEEVPGIGTVYSFVRQPDFASSNINCPIFEIWTTAKRSLSEVDCQDCVIGEIYVLENGKRDVRLRVRERVTLRQLDFQEGNLLNKPQKPSATGPRELSESPLVVRDLIKAMRDRSYLYAIEYFGETRYFQGGPWLVHLGTTHVRSLEPVSHSSALYSMAEPGMNPLHTTFEDIIENNLVNEWGDGYTVRRLTAAELRRREQLEVKQQPKAETKSDGA